MRKLIIMVCVFILLSGIPLIWHAWPRTHEMNWLEWSGELASDRAESPNAGGIIMHGVSPVWSAKERTYICPKPYEVAGGWDMWTGKPVPGYKPVCVVSFLDDKWIDSLERLHKTGK